MSGNVPKMRVELRCENLDPARAQAIPDTLRVRAHAYDHLCDLGVVGKGGDTGRAVPRTAKWAPFFAG